MSRLKSKKILFFTTNFFGYENIIKEEMERKGAKVHLYDERGNLSSIEKIILRKFPILLYRKINRYYKKIINTEEKFNPDFIFFISPESITRKCMARFREQFPHAKFILYMWDSIRNINAKFVYPMFDYCLSFDSSDCNRYGFKFRPLFFIKSFENEKPKDNFLYDFSFIGTIHSDRAKILYKLKKEFEKNGNKYFFYLYVPGKLMLVLRYILNPYVRKLKSFVYTSAMRKDGIANISKHARCIIDINHPKQNGLTMRTIETLGLEQKILTTNKEIQQYDFYQPENQLVFDRHNLTINFANLAKPYISTPKETYCKYKISSWLEDIFSCSGEKE